MSDVCGGAGFPGHSDSLVLHIYYTEFKKLIHNDLHTRLNTRDSRFDEKQKTTYYLTQLAATRGRATEDISPVSDTSVVWFETLLCIHMCASVEKKLSL